ncbi:hypothetical protein Syun_021741 [Stephania yunnanensis]|uniref:Uncharacterized protein n=1 Tax=Stephania yunnanensis TaxID=152371 RepID=A0AAP0IG51_9MAGN
MSAFQRLKQPDALFGRDRSAKVAFSQSIHPSEEALLQVKTVYLEGLAEFWEEDKLKKLCEQYGEDEKVQLCPENFFLLEGKTLGSFHLLLEKVRSLCRRDQQSEIGEGDNKVIISIVT